MDGTVHLLLSIAGDIQRSSQNHLLRIFLRQIPQVMSFGSVFVDAAQPTRTKR